MNKKCSNLICGELYDVSLVHCPYCYVKPKRKSYDNDAFYQSTAWRKLRKLYIQEHPICERCGKYNELLIVHHKVEINDNYDMRLDWNNLETLCQTCHNRHHKTGGM